MKNRRSFLKQGLLALSALGFHQSIFSFPYKSRVNQKGLKLRFALASDGHYGQPGTDSDKQYLDIITWLNKEHADKALDFVLFNGDLVHDRPDLLNHIKITYFEKLHFPFFAIPGNHDHATETLWEQIFGYSYNHAFEKSDVGFILANTSNEKGEYLCPDAKFLKDKLDVFSEKKAVFIVLHIPPVKWLKQDTFFADCPDIMKLISGYSNVKALFHGHDHSLDGVRYSGKIPHFFDAHFGSNWGTEYKGYRIVEVYDDNSIKTYQVNASSSPVLNSTKL